MSVTLGIDVGGSTTKIVGFNDEEMIGALQVRAMDQVTSMYGAIGNFLLKHDLTLGQVTSIVLTGVGASFFEDDIYGIDTYKVDEFLAMGSGGLHLAGLEEAYVVSMGTGTAFVRAGREEITHIGGSGVGGGTLTGLASKMLNKNDIEALISLAEHGRLENVDLLVSDIINHEIPSLPANLTASNFGKIKSSATDADFALAIINMVLQTIGMLAVFAATHDTIKDIVLTGTLATLPQARAMFNAVEGRFDLRFVIPPNAVYATAIGAAILRMDAYRHDTKKMTMERR
ncbi:MAG: type II pantothenate kinase [Clostridiales bacterium]|nr:type II pantothenate kinase [Clostridiales bacterium]